MLPICPECQQGKHGNCDGVGYVDDQNNSIECGCAANGHTDS